MRTAAAELVAILHDEGISHVFVNPGMHAAPLRRALAEAEAAGVPHPQPVLCVHEQIALCAAHGHHLAGGGPQAVMVHVESGELSLAGATENVQRDHVPVVVFCGGGDEVRQLLAEHADPSGRQEPALLSAASKWAVDLSPHDDVGALIRRAFQVARTEPMGLAHVALSVDLMAQPLSQASRRLLPPRPPAPDLAALEEIAELLATAENPLIIAGRVGRNMASIHHLAKLAETLAAPVIDVRNHVNLPPNHRLNAAMEGRELLSRADAILMLDVEQPCLPGLGQLPAQAWVMQIDTDCVKADLPDWICPIEIALTADTQLALPSLLTLLADRLTARRRRINERRSRLERSLRGERESWRDRAASIHPGDRQDAMFAEINRWLPEDAVIVEEAGASSRSSLRQLERQPGHYFRGPVRSPGWSMGAALGARLARPSQPVVAICDSAAFMSGLPRAAFWSAHRGGAPFLTVVLDQADRHHGQSDGPDVVSVSRASGAEVVAVDDPSDVASTLERLLATTRDGVCTVLDVRLPASSDEDRPRPPRRKGTTLTSRSTVTKRA